MENNWQCYFKKIPDKITVGEPLNLFCEGDTKLELESPVKIEFLDRQDDYSLVILNTLKQEDYFLTFQVTSYRTGLFDKSFYITDGRNTVQIDNLSFEVQSVLTRKELKPYDPFGPFKLNPDVFFMAGLAFSILVSFLFSSFFVYRFF